MEDELQVLVYMSDGSARIVRGTESKVRPIVNALIASAPVADAVMTQDTALANTSTLVDPRTPTTPSLFRSTYGDFHTYEP